MDRWNRDCVALIKLAENLEEALTKIIRNTDSKEELINEVRNITSAMRKSALEQMR